MVALIEFAASDPATYATVQELVNHVPSDRQLSVGALVADPLILGSLVVVLQSRFSFRMRQKEGKRTYELEVGKDAADASTIAQVVGRFTVDKP